MSALLLDRMGKERLEINAAALPLLAPIGRTVAPLSYQRAIRKSSPRTEPGSIVRRPRAAAQW